MVESAISFPFRIDGFGKIAVANTQEKIWADRVLTVLGTMQGTRVMRGDYGMPLNSTLHEISSDVEDLMEGLVTEAFDKFLPLLTLDSVEVFPIVGDGVIQVQVTYSLPNGKTSTDVVGVAQINGNDPSVGVN